MTRLKQAWLALRGKLEPEVRIERVPVIGTPHLVNLYKVWRITDDDLYYTTCEQAMSEFRDVSKVRAVVVDGEYFVGELARVFVEPKPKIAKGKRK